MPETSSIEPIIGITIGGVNRHNYTGSHYARGMATLGDRVREARRAARLSQAKLAQKVGIKQPTIAAIESGEIKETAHIVKIAIATGYSAYWLENERGAKRRTPLDTEALTPDELRAVVAFLQAYRTNEP